MTITGYYWDGINRYVIYQDKKGINSYVITKCQ
jgi:hypothetical protein